MNIEEENKLMRQAVRDIETIYLGAKHLGQAYCICCSKHKGGYKAEFMFDGDVKFALSANSFRRAPLCTIAASNAYIDYKAEERRRRAMERRVSPSPAEEIGATVARQEGRAE